MALTPAEISKRPTPSPNPKPPSKSQKQLIAFLGVTSLVMSFLSPLFFYVDCPFYDDWVLMKIVKAILEGSATFDHFWMPHNEHRVLFPWFLLGQWGAWTHWDMRLVPWVDLGLIFLAGLGLHRLTVRSGGTSATKIIRDPAFWIVMTFLFSLRAVESMLWTMMLSLYMAITLTMIGIAYVAQKPEALGRWALAALLAVIASYSFAGGIFFWGAVLPVFWTLRKRPIFWKVLPVWVVLALATVFFYFYHYQRPWHHPPPASFFNQPISIAYFFLIYLGGIFYSFFCLHTATAWLGFMGFALAVYFAWAILSTDRKNDARSMALLGLMGFVLVNAFLAAVARTSFGLDTAVSSRYVAISCYFWAVVGLLLYEARRRLFSALLIFFLTLALVASIFHSLPLASWAQRRWETLESLRQKPLDRAKIRSLYVFPDLAEEAVDILKDKKLACFRERRGSKK